MSRFALAAALATAFGLGSPAPASAQVTGRVEIHYDRGRAHYDRYEDSHWHRDFQGRWVTIAEGTGADGRREFWLNKDNRRYGKLRIEAVRGAPAIEKIAVNFGNGATQVIPINSRLEPGGGEIIDLDGDERRVTRVIVYPLPRSRGVYTVYGGS
jgi:hypothetical protein